jgi:hypothetical protein
MEGHISHVLAALFTSRPKAHSRSTLTKRIRIRELFVNGVDIKASFLSNQMDPVPFIDHLELLQPSPKGLFDIIGHRTTQRYKAYKNMAHPTFIYKKWRAPMGALPLPTHTNDIIPLVFQNHLTLTVKSLCTKAIGNRTITEIQGYQEMKHIVQENLDSPLGIDLRVQRSIQAEGAFGVIKENMRFRRFSRTTFRGIRLELNLIALVYNLKDFHNKQYR